MARFTRAQVRRRQRVAVAILVVVVLVLAGSCTLLVRGWLGGDDASGPGDAPASRAVGDDSALRVGRTPTEARALRQLPRGIELASDEVMGIDVSAHQQEIDWAGVASDGYVFAYIKATEGKGHTDPRFAANWADARKAGLAVGAYHYFTLCSPGADQAADFLAAAAPDDAALPPVLDLEFDGACSRRPAAEHTNAEVKAFIDRVEKAWGRRVVLYSSNEWRRHYGLELTDQRPDWLFAQGKRPKQEDWAVWQVRFTGKVTGVPTKVDIDVARAEVLRRGASLNG